MQRLLHYSLLAVSVMAAAASSAGKPVSKQGARLTVCLMNDAGVAPALKEEVERQLDGLMEDAAIHIRWLDGGDPGRREEERWACGHPEARRVVILRWMATGKQVKPGELGEAFLGKDGQGVIADLFLDRLEELTREREVNFALLLAHVSAHELGHLLLGPDAHATTGLMQAKMNEAALARVAHGNLRFSRQQEKKMHEQVKMAGEVAILAESRRDR